MWDGDQLCRLEAVRTVMVHGTDCSRLVKSVVTSIILVITSSMATIVASISQKLIVVWPMGRMFGSHAPLHPSLLQFLTHCFGLSAMCRVRYPNA